ncbi:asparaginase domain-containing protein [Roseomonas mucosa]
MRRPPYEPASNADPVPGRHHRHSAGKGEGHRVETGGPPISWPLFRPSRGWRRSRPVRPCACPAPSPEDLLTVKRVIEAGFQVGFDGAVIIQGADTIEESAFLLDVPVTGDKPVVMRTCPALSRWRLRRRPVGSAPWPC